MMTDFKIKARFLRLIAFTYGFFGIQLHPIDLNDWKSILNVVMNITLNLLVINGLWTQSSYKSMAFDKPLLSQILRICYELLYPISYIIVTIQYLLKGRKFLHNLDMFTSKTYDNDDDYDRWYLKRFIWTIFITNSTYFVMNYRTLLKLIFTDFSLINLNPVWRQLGVYFINARFHLFCNLVIYFQSSIIRFLDIMIEQCNVTDRHENQPKFSIIIDEMIDASKYCDQIQKFISINLLLMIPIMTINIIIRLCIMQYFTIINYHILLLQIIIFAIYISIMAVYNQLIAKQLSIFRDRLMIHYWNDYENLCPKNSDNNKNYIEMIIIQRYDPSRHYELKNLLENDFHIRIYHFCIVDLDLIMAIILFIINNTVFIIQTESIM
ncbi:uncharacterized protein LOC124493993 [Dermatophagoides farinae]|uniref:uncharacterized protein LOC124493993 n=1 Tax=Dermatophagoides farinae TaxID=6954 RepID=UPI003F6229DD